MNIRLERFDKQAERTLGKLYINDVYFCDVLEDADRGLDSSKPDEIASKKIHSKTAIPIGTYQVVISYSPRFAKQLPLLLNVPGYQGIRIHPGNTEADTDGCLLPGIISNNKVINSRATFDKLFSLIKKTSNNEKILITIM